jgi:hypothetical protein
MTAGALANFIFGAGLMVFIASGPTRAATNDEVGALFARRIAVENSGERAPKAPLVRLAGANGHDSVGGLMPLPLWPSLRTPLPAKSAHTRGGVRHLGHPPI